MGFYNLIRGIFTTNWQFIKSKLEHLCKAETNHWIFLVYVTLFIVTIFWTSLTPIDLVSPYRVYLKGRGAQTKTKTEGLRSAFVLRWVPDVVVELFDVQDAPVKIILKLFVCALSPFK
jgi:hypothetical protein